MVYNPEKMVDRDSLCPIKVRGLAGVLLWVARIRRARGPAQFPSVTCIDGSCAIVV